MSFDPLRDGRRRRRRRGATVAGLAAAVLSALVYQCSGKPGQGPSGRSASQIESVEVPARTPGHSGSLDARSARRFDFYLLALTFESAFCDDGNQQRRQCRALDEATLRSTPLVLHGLWPENLQPETYPHDCSAERLQLSAAVRARLERWMPGIEAGLQHHEWRKHGSCTGLDPNTYFTLSLDLTERVDKALGPALLANAGRTIDAATLRAAVSTVDPGLAQSLVLMCKNLRSNDPAKRRRSYLYEVRVCVDNDGPGGAPQSLLNCADVQRRDQGCGNKFVVDSLSG